MVVLAGFKSNPFDRPQASSTRAPKLPKEIMTPLQRLFHRFAAWGLGALALAWVAFSHIDDRLSHRSDTILSGILLALLAVAVFAWGRWMRERFVREGALPLLLKRKLREAYPSMSNKDSDLVERGLRQFFFACVRSGTKPVAMPSKVVEHMWRGFAVEAAAYESWCQTAFGRVLVPTSAIALGSNAEDNDALRRAWYWACKDEAILPKHPTRLPILFALDAKLAIDGGIVYLAHRAFGASSQRGDQGGDVHYGTSFSSSDYCGSHADFGCADGSGGDGGGGDGGGGGGGGD